VAYLKRTRDQHFDNTNGPKRILTLDGGGLRGILTLGILKAVESELRRRHGNSNDFRLCHYFDLIAGTSTGGIIAAALALGMTVDEIIQKYRELGSHVFRRSLLRQGLFRAKYDERQLIDALKAIYGANTTVGDSRLQTGLLLIIKRLDTASPWPVSNNPKGQFFVSQPRGTIGNGDYKLWQAVRASTAAPDYFVPERITVAELPGHPAIHGDFVDGGVSPFNNPALQAFMYVTASGYRVKWPMGDDKILLVSVGTGIGDPGVRRSEVAAAHALRALLSLLDDCAALQEMMLQWISKSPTARTIDEELGALDGDLLGSTPLLHYVRYNSNLQRTAVNSLLGGAARTTQVENLTAMDSPENMDALYAIGLATGERDVKASHLPRVFDLA
jgi:predicted acylesterase/phospholipase RssA